LAALLYILYLACLGLGFYELTAKTPAWVFGDLPGRSAARLAERSVPWERPTGVLPVDKLLHEGREAVVFYRALGPANAQRRGPALSRRSSRSLSSAR
jgi:hypothetical protein